MVFCVVCLHCDVIGGNWRIMMSCRSNTITSHWCHQSDHREKYIDLCKFLVEPIIVNWWDDDDQSIHRCPFHPEWFNLYSISHKTRSIFLFISVFNDGMLIIYVVPCVLCAININSCISILFIYLFIDLLSFFFSFFLSYIFQFNSSWCHHIFIEFDWEY